MVVSEHVSAPRVPVSAIEGLRLWQAERKQRAESKTPGAAVGDTVSLSAEAVAALGAGSAGTAAPSTKSSSNAGIYNARGHGGRARALGHEQTAAGEQSPEAGATDGPPATAPLRAESPDTAELTDEEQHEVDELQARDAEVRQHEQAHAARGGRYAGAPKYEYDTGPDGRRYVVDGSVSIDVAEVRGDPEATLRKMDIVIASAMAPVEPSTQDHAVAAEARATQREARAELIAEQREADEADSSDTSDPTSSSRPEGDPATMGTVPRPLGASLQAYQAHAGYAG